MPALTLLVLICALVDQKHGLTCICLYRLTASPIRPHLWWPILGAILLGFAVDYELIDLFKAIVITYILFAASQQWFLMSCNFNTVKLKRKEWCTICMEERVRGEIMVETPCGHRFDKSCIEEWFKTSNSNCPLCRASCI